MIPIEPARAVKMVLPFLVSKLWNDNPKEVKKDIEVLFIFLFLFSIFIFSGGLLSLMTTPSFSSIILLE